MLRVSLGLEGLLISSESHTLRRKACALPAITIHMSLLQGILTTRVRDRSQSSCRHC